MTDDRELELISAAVDGELAAGDQAKLDALLESSAEALAFKSELEQLDSLMRGIPDLEPPAFLHASIMARTKVARPNPSFLEFLSALRPGAGLRYALAAAAGALVVVIMFQNRTMLSDGSYISDLVGTMAPGNASTEADIIDSFSFRQDGLESLVQLQRSQGFMILVVRVDATTPVDISVDLTGAGLEPDALEQINSDFESIAIAGQTLHLRAVGEQRMTILLRRVDDAAFAGEATIVLEFSSDGKLLQRGALTANLTGVKQ
ncbi:MAG: hypothetical protein IID58_05815 [Proteobacteria bacterium]|nr:hypothetical protein [Pseudomonadota bacterium]